MITINRPRDNFIFHNAVTTTGNGNILTVNDAENVKIFITASSTFTVYFEDSFDGATYFPVQAYNNTSKSLVSTTTDATAAYTVDLTGSNYFRVRVSANTGTLSVKGRVSH